MVKLLLLLLRMEGRQYDPMRKEGEILSRQQEGKRTRLTLEIVFKGDHKALPITYLKGFTMPNVLAVIVL